MRQALGNRGFIAIGSVMTAIFMSYVIMRSLIGVPTLNTARIPTFEECKSACAGLTGQIAGFVKASVKRPADVV